LKIFIDDIWVDLRFHSNNFYSA